MIFFITESRGPHRNVARDHFRQRNEERVLGLEGLNASDERNLLTKLREIKKTKFPKNGTIVKRIYSVPKQRYRSQLIRFKGGKTILWVDGAGKRFYGDEFWVIIKGGEPVTLLIRESNLTRQGSRAREMFAKNNERITIIY
jgi:hypothetical protein